MLENNLSLVGLEIILAPDWSKINWMLAIVWGQFNA